MQSSPRRVGCGLDHGDDADDGVKDPMDAAKHLSW